MGQRILLTCDKCNCKKEMPIGAGLSSRMPNAIANCLNEEEAKEWKRLCDQKEIRLYYAENKAYYCDTCKDLVCQLKVEALLVDENRVIYGKRCKKCHSELQEIDLHAGHMTCPICKIGDLSWIQTGVWD